MCSSPLVPLPPLWPQTSPSSSSSPLSPSSPTPLGTLITTYLTAPPQNVSGLNSESKKKAESALTIPLHLSSPPRSNIDHLGNTCTVLDCVINPVVLEATTHSRPLKMFLVQLALGETEKILHRHVDPQFKLPKMKTKGDLAPLDTSLITNHPRELSSSFLKGGERLLEGEENFENFENFENRWPGGEKNIAGEKEASHKTKKIALLEEEQEETGAAYTTKKAIANPSSLLPQMKQSIVRFQGSPQKATAAVVTLHLPSPYMSSLTRSNGSSSKALENHIQITSKIDSVSVIVPGYAPVYVQLPFAVHVDKTTAVLSSLPQSKKILTLTLPFASFDEIKTTWTQGME